MYWLSFHSLLIQMQDFVHELHHRPIIAITGDELRCDKYKE
jgi:hypothetical protein